MTQRPLRKCCGVFTTGKTSAMAPDSNRRTEVDAVQSHFAVCFLFHVRLGCLSRTPTRRLAKIIDLVRDKVDSWTDDDMIQANYVRDGANHQSHSGTKSSQCH